MKEILQKYIDGDCSKEEFEQAATILKGEKGKAALDVFMDHHWKSVQKADDQELTVKLDSALDRIHHQINLKEKGISLFNRFYGVFSKVAAILLLPLMLLLSYNWLRSVPSGTEAYTTLSMPMGMQGKVDLPDGSKVWLNAGSQLVFPSTFKGQQNRKVALTGEGYFEVEKNTDQPFYVDVNGFSVKVLGTAFNVSAYNPEDVISVALLHGSVQLLKPGASENDKNIFLSPNQIGHYHRKNNRVNVAPRKDIKNLVAWKEGKMIFKNEALRVVLDKMSRKYNVDYVVIDPEIMDYHITGTFIYETFDEFMKILKLSSPIDYEIVNGSAGKDGAIGKRTVRLKKKN